jgi:single-stranded-DNA-specific exonuclease
MTSTPQTRWEISPFAPAEFRNAVPGTHQLVMQVLWARGYRSAEDVAAFFACDATNADPFALPDMTVAVERILRAIHADEKIAVYGDYDCDGVTSCALLMQVLTAFKARAQVYIPDRFEEGYGLHADALDKLKADGVSLVITVDCGARANAEALHARAIGLDLIVTDHHALEHGDLPDAIAVINPTRADPANRYPFRSLAGVGVAFRLAQALLTAAYAETGVEVDCDDESLLDLVAIGTVADVAQLVGENRALVQAGLQRINTQPRVGVRYLAASAGARVGTVTSQTIGFAMGPRLNAAGRIEHARDAYQLLITTSESEAAEIVQRLNERNEQRQRATDGVTRSAEARAIADGQTDVPLLFAASEDYSSGVIGLAAARLVERFYKPAVVVATHMGEARGSCRSVDGFNITAALDQCKDLLARHGGHAAAAGFTTPAVSLEPLRARLIEIARAQRPEGGWKRALNIDTEINLHKTTMATYEALTVLEPHGMGNPRPTFVARGAIVHSIKRVGKTHAHDGSPPPPPGPHLQLYLKDAKGVTWQVVGWRMGERAGELSPAAKIDIVFQLDINEWNGDRKLQLVMQDFKTSET